ncbi:MAG: CCA tRNA nucleotidyltransferase [Thermoplasmata archaeon]
MSLEQDILAEIKPTREEVEETLRIAESLLRRLAEEAREQGIPAKPLLVGSVAKGTFLKEPEIDAFVAFSPETSREDLERWGLRLGRVLDEPTLRYAEHPYTRGVYQGLEVDVVPCYELDRPSARMTAVDRTPFHFEYVREHMSGPQKDQVRLLKRFLKGTGTYGAEARVQGFSGYLSELLVLRYGTFRAVLGEAAQWRPPIRLALEAGTSRPFDEPLVFVDPVDDDRNAGSAVSSHTLALFILAAKAYEESADRRFFFPEPVRPLSLTALRKVARERGTALLGVAASAPDLSEDVVYPQLRKAEQAIRSFLREAEFKVLSSQPSLLEKEWLVLLELESGELPPVRKHVGPPTWLGHAEAFRAKWEGSSQRVAGPYIEGDRLVVDVKREEPTARGALAKRLPGLSLGKDLHRAVKEGYEVLEGEEIARAGYRGPLTEFLRREFPWQVRKSPR